MNKLILKLVMLPSGIWRGMGADVEQLRAILDVRLKLDDRKPVPIGRQRTQKKERRHGSALAMFLSLIMGVGYMFPLVLFKDRILGVAIYFTAFMFLLTLMLITDFSNILFDTRDKFIIIPRPVNDATIVLSRLLHVFIYLVRIVLPMSLPGWIALGIMDGWRSAVIFIIPLLLLIFIVVFLVNSIYLLLLKLTKAEHFKDIINYFQIFFSIVFFATIMFINSMWPKMVDENTHALGIATLDISKYGWVRLLPTYWLASFWSLLGFPVTLPGTQWLCILAVIFPLTCLWLLIKYLAPQFARNIGSIDVVASAEIQTSGVQTGKKKSKFYLTMANLLNKNDISRAGFIIAWLQTSRSRSFRMKVYPLFAFVPIYFLYMLTTMKGQSSYKEVFEKLSERTSLSLFLLYYCSFMLVQVMNYLNISDQYKAAWVYYAAPVATPGRIMSGAFKAMWVKFFLPLFGGLAVLVVAIWGWNSIIDVLLAMVNITLFAMCIMRVSYRHLPFSMQENINQGGNRIIRSLLSMAIPALLGLGHFWAINILWLKLLFMALSAILLWLVWDSYENTTWDVIKKTEFE